MQTLYKSTPMDKAVPIICLTILAAFVISLPFMVRDEDRRKVQAWQTQGCEMYDDYQLEHVPAKCQTFFVDHYKAQAARLQPPEQGGSR